jgi:hypothetical protein
MFDFRSCETHGLSAADHAGGTMIDRTGAQLFTETCKSVFTVLLLSYQATVFIAVKNCRGTLQAW